MSDRSVKTLLDEGLIRTLRTRAAQRLGPEKHYHKVMRASKLAVLFLLAIAAFAANIRLYMKDGTHHLVREYEVKEDRVRFYSIERGDWEELPVEMADLTRTAAEAAERKASLDRETALIASEDKAERDLRREIARVPAETGVYLVDGQTLKPLTLAQSKIHTKKGRSVLKALSPLPVVTGKATLELDGEQSGHVITGVRPEFYMRLAEDERFGIIRLSVQKGVRVVERLTLIPVTKETVEEREAVEIFRQQVDEGLYKIWPQNPLEPGEYAVVEFTEGKVNIQVWDFKLTKP